MKRWMKPAVLFLILTLSSLGVSATAATSTPAMTGWTRWRVRPFSVTLTVPAHDSDGTDQGMLRLRVFCRSSEVNDITISYVSTDGKPLALRHVNIPHPELSPGIVEEGPYVVTKVDIDGVTKVIETPHDIVRNDPNRAVFDFGPPSLPYGPNQRAGTTSELYSAKDVKMLVTLDNGKTSAINWSPKDPGFVEFATGCKLQPPNGNAPIVPTGEALEVYINRKANLAKKGLQADDQAKLNDATAELVQSINTKNEMNLNDALGRLRALRFACDDGVQTTLECQAQDAVSSMEDVGDEVVRDMMHLPTQQRPIHKAKPRPLGYPPPK